ncbi:hypothetical protein QCA50_008051 [Cerrena zonata]|uniref:Uncharacterized protein n=1 Tax=Cerrena zonata TaxID=2478898 RepID=A0AAW0G5F7_9APHY
MPPSSSSTPNMGRPLYNVFTRMLSPRSQFDPVRSQWENPNDVLSILMIIGGDIVQRAVAQLAGHPSHFVPVAFSFGWVGYALNAVLSAIGEGRLMPPSDCDCILLNAKSGYIKENRSWVLSRLVRDHHVPTAEAGLTISVYKTDPERAAGIPAFDWVFYSGIATIILQLGVAVIPGAVNHDWNTLIVTIAGTLLSLAGGALPQWRKEKWACRRLKAGVRKVICLARGNGFKDVIVIISEGEGQLRLEDLATPREARDRITIFATSVLFILQIALLLTVAGLQNHAWYILAIGSLGMLQNGVAAGARRSPSSSGIHLNSFQTIYDKKVFNALVKVEALESHVGVSLLPVFFPGGLKKHEEEWRSGRLTKYAEDEELKARQKAQNGTEKKHPIAPAPPRANGTDLPPTTPQNHLHSSSSS